MKLYEISLKQLSKYFHAGSRRRRILSASSWNLGGYVARNIFRLGSSLILTRLLAPEMFGLMALVWSFLTVLEMISDTGVRAFIIRREKLCEDRLLDTVFTIQASRGVLLWFCTFLLAKPVADFYQQPMLESLLPVVGLTILFRGLVSPALIVAEKQLAYKKNVFLEMSCYLVNLTVMICWAWRNPSVWAIVAGSVIDAGLMAFLSHILFRNEKIWFSWNGEVARESFHFGKWIFLSTILTLIANQTDRIFIGKFFSMAELGVYSIAMLLYFAYRQVVTLFYSKVFFPSLAELQSEKRSVFVKKYYNYRHVADWLLVTGGMILLISGGTFIALVYDVRYHSAGDMLGILMISGILMPVLLPMEMLTVTLGEPVLSVFANLLRVLWIVSALPFAALSFGIIGAVYAVGFLEILPLLYWIFLMMKKRYFYWRYEMRIVYPLVAGLVTGLVCEFLMERLFL